MKLSSFKKNEILQIFENLLEGLDDIIYIKDRKCRFLACNDAAVKALKAESKEDVIGKTDFDFLPEDIAEIHLKEEQEIMKTGISLINSEISSNYGKRWATVNKIPFSDENGKISGIIGITKKTGKLKRTEIELEKHKNSLEGLVEERTNELEETNILLHNEIIERTKAENALENERNSLRTLINTIPFQIFIKDTESRFIECNKSTIYQLGRVSGKPDIKLQDIIGKTDHDFIPKELADKYRAKEKEIMKKRIPQISEEEHHKGSNFYTLISKVPFYDSRGNILGLVCTLFDMSSLKQAKTELRHMNTQMEFLLETTKTGFDIIDSNFNLIYVDPIRKKLLGSTESKTCYEYFHNRKDICPDCGPMQALKTKLPVIKESFFKTFNCPVQITSIPFLNDRGEWVVAEVVVDITERTRSIEEKKKLEEQFYQSQKMESVGRLAGGIAHDFNNILTSILGFAEFLKSRISESTPREKHAAEIIVKCADRAANLTQQLLTFARKENNHPIPLNVNIVLKDTVKMSEKMFEKNISVNYDLDKDIKNALCDIHQLEQVFMNLIVNAKDAMPAGGELYLKTWNVEISQIDKNLYPTLKPGKYVNIIFTDTGVGMTGEIKKQIFEPFFTTKDQGTGTGLGLATVYGIIKNHNGYIYCSSSPGNGATFKIFLPVSLDKQDKKDDTAAIIKGHSTILFVDDEEYVREFFEMQLQELGYKVILASDGIEAIKKYKKHKQEIDLVIMDMIMPNMAGPESIKELKKINPDVKVLVMSGFSPDGKTREVLKNGASGFLQKPFNMTEVSNVINNIVNS